MPSIPPKMSRTVRSLCALACGLGLLALTACHPEPPLQPSASGGYDYTLTIAPRTNPDGTTGSEVRIEVRPPDPNDPAQRAIAAQLREEFLRRFQTQRDGK
jgi:hypothetical protein